jgi:hypothetical protein
MYTERVFLPTRGRVERQVTMRREAGLCFRGEVRRSWRALFSRVLVYERSTDPEHGVSRQHHLRTPRVVATKLGQRRLRFLLLKNAVLMSRRRWGVGGESPSG